MDMGVKKICETDKPSRPAQSETAKNDNLEIDKPSYRGSILVFIFKYQRLPESNRVLYTCNF